MNDTGTAVPAPSEDDGDHVHELEAVGLLVAGALTPTERLEVERHLRLCELCRDELVEVAALPGLLRRVADDGGAAAGPTLAVTGSATARARLVTAAQTTMRRRRRRQSVLASAVLLPIALGATLLVGPLGQRESAGPELVAMQRADAAVQVDGSLATEGRSWGTEVTVQMRWAKEASAVLVAVGRDGREQEAGWWRAPAGQDVLCRGATSLQPTAVARWEVRTADGAPLLVLPA